MAWLDDIRGNARKPTELRVRTPGAEAVFGKDSPDFLHPDLDRPNSYSLLATLGVSTEPSTSELVDRLRQLRMTSDDSKASLDDVRSDAVLVYRALAQRFKTDRTDSNVNPRQQSRESEQLRREFGRDCLVLTCSGWMPPQNVFAGPRIFGDRRQFALAITECEPLWDFLGLRRPSPDDCLQVLREVARRRDSGPDSTEEAILIKTLRALAKHPRLSSVVKGPKWRRLALWTSMGWARDRPVYATDDPVLADGLGDQIPIWKPGGELEQFRPLLDPLRVTELQASDAEVMDHQLAREDDSLTELFRAGVELLHDELQRNNEDLARRLNGSWEKLMTYQVKVHQTLELQVSVPTGHTHACRVKAAADIDRATVFVVNGNEVTRVNGVGMAIAALFSGKAREVAREWVAACQQAEEGIPARPLDLAQERADRVAADFSSDSRLESLSNAIMETHSSNRISSGHPISVTQQSNASTGGDKARKSSPPATNPRTLVDPQSLAPIDPKERKLTVSRGTWSSAATSSGGLNEPRLGSYGPKNRTSLRDYSDLDREEVGLELLRCVLGSDENEIVDLRAQRGVGADAIDQMGRFYELKVYAGPEPDVVTLTGSEVQRALTTRDFFLVVVSNVEEREERPQVRIVVDPLEHLRPIDRGSITLLGVREAKSLVIPFAPIHTHQTEDAVE